MNGASLKLTRKRRMMEFSERAFSTKNSELMTSSCKLVVEKRLKRELRYFTDFLLMVSKAEFFQENVKDGT